MYTSFRKVSTTYMTLSIEDVLLQDDGFYTCHARYHHDISSDHCFILCSLLLPSTSLDRAQTKPGFLDVKMRTKVQESPSNIVGVLGNPAQLKCLVGFRFIYSWTICTFSITETILLMFMTDETMFHVCQFDFIWKADISISVLHVMVLCTGFY